MARTDAFERRREHGERSRRGRRGGRRVRDLREREPMMVRIIVWCLKTDEPVRELTVNFNDPIKRKWLLRVQLWAFNDRKSVEILLLEDDELDKGNAETGPRQDRLSR